MLGFNTEAAGENLDEALSYWEKIISNSPTYKDGWIEIYNINLKLGNMEEALKALEVAKRIY